MDWKISNETKNVCRSLVFKFWSNTSIFQNKTLKFQDLKTALSFTIKTTFWRKKSLMCTSSLNFLKIFLILTLSRLDCFFPLPKMNWSVCWRKDFLWKMMMIDSSSDLINFKSSEFQWYQSIHKFLFAPTWCIMGHIYRNWKLNEIFYVFVIISQW